MSPRFGLGRCRVAIRCIAQRGVEQEPQLILIRCWSDVLTRALLGAGPARRIRARRIGIVNQLRDAKIKQLGTPVRIDQYIGRFDIAVDE
ncbi:MAG: hypothetical protein SGI99_04170 [Pseudomonadota bacterium]|nr:hypothetical protein [Pseudomonadota bacterium]